MVPRFERVHDLPDELRPLQDAVARVLDELLKLPSIQATTLTQIALATGSDQQVAHKRGRKWIGWRIVRQSGAADVYEATTQQDDRTYLSLVTSANVTVDIEVW